MHSKSLPSVWKQPRRHKNGQFARKLKGGVVMSLLIGSVIGVSLLSQQKQYDDLMKILHPTFMFRQPDPELPQLVGQAKAKEIETPTASASPSIEDRILMRFQEKGEMMLAIAKPESGLNPKAKGWNCIYSKEGLIKDSKTVQTDRSKACKVQDRDRAWSVDCGVFQINFNGTECPESSYDVNTNFELANGKLERQGYNAWSVYKSGKYKQYLLK